MFGLPGGVEWIVIGVIALLLFGKRLPEVMRSVGKGITEFKRGMHDLTDEVGTLTDVSAQPAQVEPPKKKRPHDDDDYAYDQYEEDDYEDDGPGQDGESDDDGETTKEASANNGKDVSTEMVDG